MGDPVRGRPGRGRLVSADDYAATRARNVRRYGEDSREVRELDAWQQARTECDACSAEPGEPCREWCIGHAAHLDENGANQ